MVSLIPRYCRSQPASAIHKAPPNAPARQTITVPARLAGSGRPCARPAQASPPNTTAPSPPMTVKPARAGMATHRAVSIRGAARCSVFCQEYQSPNAPLNSSSQTSRGLTPANQTNTPNSPSAAMMAPAGSRMLASELRMNEDVSGPRRSGGSHGADHAFDEVVHLFQLEVGLLEDL